MLTIPNLPAIRCIILLYCYIIEIILHKVVEIVQYVTLEDALAIGTFRLSEHILPAKAYVVQQLTGR